MEAKNIVIVGGSKGIGLKTTKQLVNIGHNVFVYSRINQGITDLTNVNFQEVDVNHKSFELQNLPDLVHGFTYCPGTINLRPFKSLKLEDFEADLQITTWGGLSSIH